jgi:hypothetical protein
VVELVKVFSYANGEGESEGRCRYGWGKEWGGARSGNGVTREAIRWPEAWGGGALGRRWTREEEDDCLVGLCGPRG